MDRERTSLDVREEELKYLLKVFKSEEFQLSLGSSLGEGYLSKMLENTVSLEDRVRDAGTMFYSAKEGARKRYREALRVLSQVADALPGDEYRRTRDKCATDYRLAVTKLRREYTTLLQSALSSLRGALDGIPSNRSDEISFRLNKIRGDLAGFDKQARVVVSSAMTKRAVG